MATVRDGYLNCDSVQTIPAHGSVNYEMRLALPDDQPTGFAKFGWHLQGDVGPGTGAPLVVRAAGS